MLGAIAAHKLVVAFCLGIEVAASHTNTACKHFVSIAIFSFGSVLGIGVGMFATEIPKKLSNLTVPILQARKIIIKVNNSNKKLYFRH